MSVIIRLQNLPLSANSIDIRNFFRGLAIPDGGVHIVGGAEGDAFIAFSTDEDARQGMQLSGTCLKDTPVKLLLSSRNEMYKVIEQARQQALGLLPSASNSPTENVPLQSQSQSQSGGGGGGLTSQHQQSSLQLSQMSSAASNAVVANLGLGFPGAGTNVNAGGGSTGVAFPGLGGHLVPGTLGMSQSNFPSMMGGQGDPTNFTGIFSQQASSGGGGGGGSSSSVTVAGTALTGSRAMTNTSMAPSSQNPFILPQTGAGSSTLPMGYAANVPNGSLSGATVMGGPTSNPNLMGMSAASLPTMAGPNIGPNQFGLSAPSRMPMVSSMTGPGGGIMPPYSGLGPQGYSGMNPNLMSPGLGGASAVQMGGGGNPPRPGFNPNHQPQQQQQHHHHHQQQQQHNSSNNNSMGLAGFNRTERRGGPPPDRGAPGNFGKMNSGPGPMGGGQREREGNLGFGPRGDRDTRGRERERRSQSRSRDRKEGRDRSRRGSRSRDRDRSRERRRGRRSKSRSRSRERDRARSRRGLSRDRDRPREERRRSDAGSTGSPDKQLKADGGKHSSPVEPDKKYGVRDPSVETIVVTITDETHPCAKLSGLSKDTSFREIREFIRVDVQGGGEGVVRNYEKGLAFLKLENPSDFPRLLRQNGQKLRGNVIKIEGVSLDAWDTEYKLNKRQLEREKEREKEQRDRERERDRDHRDRDRSADTRDRPRTSRFNGGATQSNCITIRGLPPAVTPKDVAAKFFHDINVLDMVCLPDESAASGRVTMTAWVQLDSVLSAQRAVDVIVKSPEGTGFVVELCELEDVQRAKREAFGGGDRGLGGGQLMGRDGGGNNSSCAEAKSLFELDIGLDMDSSSVIIAGAPPGANERTVLDFFSEIGLTPTSVRTMFDPSGMPNGQILCEFSDPSKARRATTKDGTLFGRVPVKVSLWPPSKGSMSRGSSNNNNNNNSSSNSSSSHLGLSPAMGNNPFNPRGTRPALLGPRPTMQNSNTRFNNSNHQQSQNPFTQALQQSMPSPNSSNMMSSGLLHTRPRGPLGERSSRFSNNGGGSSSSERDDRAKHSGGGGRGDDMAPFENPGCVLALENVPFKASMDDILKFLEDMLKIQIPRNRIIRRFDDNQKPTGDARVAFDTPFEAKLAYQRLVGSTMWKRPISVSVLNYF